MPPEAAAPIPAARLIVADRQGRVLILRRAAGTHSAGRWCLPGGKVDYGDTVEAAARRELMEECGLDCRELRFLFYQDSLPAIPGDMHCINLYLACRADGQVQLNSESDQHAWISERQLAEFDLAFRNDDGLKKYWRDLRQFLSNSR